jgi:hypothetical protein
MVGSLSVFGQSTTARTAVPVEPVAAILDAFRTHSIVAVSDPPGNVQQQQFLLSLIRDPRFIATVDDIVIETASSRYQDVIDRFVRGEDVPRTVLRNAWEDHTVVGDGLGTHTAEFLDAVRAVNTSTRGTRKLRVIAGDPPIDWSNIATEADHRRWIDLRDSYPADLIHRQVIDRGRRALVVYGQMHLQRKQMASNYDMSTWQAQTIVSLVEHDAGVHVFNVWTLFERGVSQPQEVTSWRVPSLAVVKATTLGAQDFGTYTNGLGARFAVQNGQLVPLQKEQWNSMRMDDQFDAVLYLGPTTALTAAATPDTELCRDADFVAKRMRRLSRFAPPPALASFKRACGL